MRFEEETALVVVDMQNAFVAPYGALVVPGAPEVLASVNAWVAEAAEHGCPVFYTQDIGPSDDTAGDAGQTSLCAGLDIRGVIVQKGPGRRGGFSGFVLAPTGEPDRLGPGAGGLSTLAGQLRDANVRSVIVVGLAADVCVAATARDGRRLGYEVTVALDATAFVHAHPGGDDAAVGDLRRAGISLVTGNPRELLQSER